MEQNQLFIELVTIIKEEMAKYHARKLILFGSRATGNARPESDYDFMILVDDELPTLKYSDLTFAIHKRLWETDRITPLDLIIKNQQRFTEESESFGSLAYHVKAEGVTL